METTIEFDFGRAIRHNSSAIGEQVFQVVAAAAVILGLLAVTDTDLSVLHRVWWGVTCGGVAVFAGCMFSILKNVADKQLPNERGALRQAAHTSLFWRRVHGFAVILSFVAAVMFWALSRFVEGVYTNGALAVSYLIFLLLALTAPAWYRKQPRPRRIVLRDPDPK